MINADTGVEAVQPGTKITPRLINKLLDGGLKKVLFSVDDIIGQFIAEDIVNMKTGLVYAEAGDEITTE